jgi:effector-binding domain-containing protein
VGVEVSGSFEPTSTVVSSSLPGGVVATTAHLGLYTGIPQAHAAIREWCAAQGRRAAGPTWEIYGDWTDDPNELRTDVFHLLA